MYRRGRGRRSYRKKRYNKSLKSSIKKRCGYAKRIFKTTQSEMKILRPNYARRTFINWTQKELTLGVDFITPSSAVASVAEIQLDIGSFLSATDRSTQAARFGLIHTHCLMIEVRCIGTQNMQRVAQGAASNQTKVTEGPSNYYDPNIQLFWDRQGYGNGVVNAAAGTATKLQSLPGLQFLPVSGGQVFMKWEQPQYAKGKLVTFPSATNVAVKTIVPYVDAIQAPDKLYAVWLNPSSYTSGTKANGGATIMLEIKAAMVADLTKQITYINN